MLLDQAGYTGPRELLSVSDDQSAGACAILGAQLAGQAGRVALLVMADGSARRTLKAPGYLDERSAPFDDEIARLLAGPDLTPLLAVDPDLASELMATGRPAWQVLAGAARGLRARTQIRYRDDPFGVAYLVAAMGFSAPPAVALRPVEERDLDATYEYMRDPQAVHMAAFTAPDPDDRAAFDTHMAMVRTSPGITHRAVTCDGELAGHVASFVVDGDTEVTYWIGRAWWGRGVASRALELLLELVPTRPLHCPRAASDNVASLRVLAKEPGSCRSAGSSRTPGRARHGSRGDDPRARTRRPCVRPAVGPRAGRRTGRPPPGTPRPCRQRPRGPGGPGPAARRPGRRSRWPAAVRRCPAGPRSG